ncbi:hypothetical protein CBR_g21097 [Chara braunii]|uniref:Uncharacterized protein n=1 Tax=Chara braunii TaxID=69332 RepID=A0A388L0W4_CHABU|nr:hypothetical protein CBR_g21097 [Chara braunii]|eukprot:GBG75853.1 hypothetical protein CBR_g21097 [Chara braunii]
MLDSTLTTCQLLIQTLEKGAPAVVAELREGPVTTVRRKEEKDSWGAEVGAKEELMAMVVEGGRDAVMTLAETWAQKECKYLLNQTRNEQDTDQKEQEFFLIQMYEGVFREIGLLLVGNKQPAEVSSKAREEAEEYVLRNGHLFKKEEGMMPRRVVCGGTRQLDVIQAMHDGLAGGHRSHAFGKVFLWNTNYETSGVLEEEPDILLWCKQLFREKGLQNLGPWKPDGWLGVTYVIPKHKDLQRWTPIAPALADPAGVAQRRIARALHYLLMRVPIHNSFFLNSVGDIGARLEATAHSLHAEGWRQAVGRCYDIKEMFAHIPHTAVMQAVHQLVRRFEDWDWKLVKVSYRAKACILSKTAKATDEYMKINLKQLLDAVEYDLRHSLIRCGSKVMRQVFGIPMGKSTTPVLACITCAMAEEKFLREIGADRRLIGGWRIMDDISLVVGCRPNDTQGNTSNFLFELFENNYDENLEIVWKDKCGWTWDFVGGTMFVRNNPIELHYVPNTKNIEALHEEGRLVFQTMRDYASFTEKQTKKVVLAATIKRL